MSFATPVHPDEVFQYLETAHRLLFGQGVVTWEWREGIRGWLLPWLTAGPMGLGAALAPHGGLQVVLPNLTMVLVSLVTVAIAWRLGMRVSRLHAQVAAFVAAVWYEFIYFAPHVMSETASIALILPAAALLLDRERWTPPRLAFAAFLLANAAALRFQHLPAIAVLVVACCLLDLRRCWLPLLIGGLIGLVPSAVSDLAMGQLPFAWIVENFRLNIGENRAAAFSASGPFGYAAEIWPRLLAWVIPLLAFAYVGARRYPALASMAIANLVFHSMVAHKEHRFILLSAVVAVILAAIGTVDWVEHIRRRDGDAAARSKLRFICVVWLIASVSCSLGPFRSQWLKFRPEMQLYAHLRDDPQLCGIAVYRHHFTLTGGYAYLNRDVPMLYFSPDTPQPAADLAVNTAAFNTIMTRADFAAEVPQAYRQIACDGKGELRICLLRRPGPCAETGQAFAINAVLARLGQ